MIKLNSTRLTLCAATAAAGFALGAAAPAAAQAVLGEITVIGRIGPEGQLQSLSRVVDIGDLDLSTPAGVDAMHDRVRAAASNVCSALGADRTPPTLSLKTCEDQAIDNAEAQMKMAVNNYRPGGTAVAVIPPPAPAPTGQAVPSAAVVAVPAPTYTLTTVTNGPVPDTPENRARFGGPMSNAGQRTAPAGN